MKIYQDLCSPELSYKCYVFKFDEEVEVPEKIAKKLLQSGFKTKGETKIKGTKNVTDQNKNSGNDKKTGA